MICGIVRIAAGYLTPFPFQSTSGDYETEITKEPFQDVAVKQTHLLGEEKVKERFLGEELAIEHAAKDSRRGNSVIVVVIGVESHRLETEFQSQEFKFEVKMYLVQKRTKQS